jgi:IS30 family transposase
MAKRELYDTILKYLAEQQNLGHVWISRADIATALGESPSTVLRYLNRPKADGKVDQSGSTSASRYGLASREALSGISTCRQPHVLTPSIPRHHRPGLRPPETFSQFWTRLSALESL